MSDSDQYNESNHQPYHNADKPTNFDATDDVKLSYYSMQPKQQGRKNEQHLTTYQVQRSWKKRKLRQHQRSISTSSNTWWVVARMLLEDFEASWQWIGWIECYWQIEGNTRTDLKGSVGIRLGRPTSSFVKEWQKVHLSRTCNESKNKIISQESICSIQELQTANFPSCKDLPVHVTSHLILLSLKKLINQERKSLARGETT